MKWPKVRLDACAEIVSGATPRTNVPEYWGGSIHWATPKDLSDLDGKHIVDTPDKLTQAGYDSCSTQLLPPQSVLFSSRAPIGHVAINTVPMCTNQGFKSFVPHPDRLNADYLYHWLRANKSYLQSLGNGATFKEVSKAIVSRVEIPLPPLPEQRRIAAILDKADALRAQRRQAIAKLDRLVQAVFLEMFGDPVTNPKGWQTVLVGDAFSAFVGGKNVECPESGSSPFRILKVSAVTKKTFMPDQSKLAPDDFVPDEDHIVRPGDLLFSRANTAELVAATAYVWQTPPNLVLPDKIWRMVLRDTTKIDSLFAWELFKNSEFRNELSKRSSGTSGSMKNISKAKLVEVPMPLPPLPRQRQFAQVAEKIQQQKQRLEQHAAELDTLFASLQQRAFSAGL